MSSIASMTQSRDVRGLEYLEKQGDIQTGTERKTRPVEQINSCLRAGDYSRALDLLRGAAAEFPNDPELSKLETLAQDGIKRNAEANRLITESQNLFAQRKSAEAIQLLRKAYDLDKNNSLARAILANALVEHAHTVVETDWLEAETLANQALKLNPAHPTAKTVHSLILERKQTSTVEDWVTRASKLQSSGDLFAALTWIAEGLAVHPDDPKLVQIHDAIQRDQGARRRQARRGDVEDLRRMELEIDQTPDAVAKQALAERIQALAAKYWTDGEILSVANRLLQRLGFVPEESSTPTSGKNATVIFHVPRPLAPEVSGDAGNQVRASHAAPSKTPPSESAPSEVISRKVSSSSASSENVATAASSPTEPIPNEASTSTAPVIKVPPSEVRLRKVPPSIAPVQLLPTVSQKTEIHSSKSADPTEAKSAESPAQVASPISQPKQRETSKSAILIAVSVAAVFLVAATFFITRRHYEAPVSKIQPSAADVSVAKEWAPSQMIPAQVAPTQPPPEPSTAPVAVSSEAPPKVVVSDKAAAGSVHNLGTLLVMAGEDNAKVFLDGKLQPQLTRAGRLRVPNLELKDYVVQVSKSGFQDPPEQKIKIHDSEETKLVFYLQPEHLPSPHVQQNVQLQPSLASLTIKGGVPGTAVLVDQAPVGAIQSDGTLSVSTINAGDHLVELRKERFKPRQLKEHFIAGGTIALAAADAALEAAPGELKITFTPADATVALVKGDLLKVVNSGAPLSLAAGTYTLTARTADRFTRSSTLEVIAGQSKSLDLSLAPNGMAKWEDAGAWQREGDSFTRKGGDFVLYKVVPTSGTFTFSAMITKGHLLQWVLDYIDPKNYILFQMDDNNFYRTVIRNGMKMDELKVPDKGDKKTFRTIQIRVGSAEIVQQIKHSDRWFVLDRWTQPGIDLSEGKFGLYIPDNDEVALSSFVHYSELNIH